MTDAELNAMSPLALAHVGDAVFDLLVRTRLCLDGRLTAGDLHRETVRYVSAVAQAAAAKKLLPLLDQREEGVYRRGRNAHSHAAPKGATPMEYHAATGLEALFGWLYLRGEKARIEELFSHLMED
jgi:ribonuclease-3 family protein